MPAQDSRKLATTLERLAIIVQSGLVIGERLQEQEGLLGGGPTRKGSAAPADRSP